MTPPTAQATEHGVSIVRLWLYGLSWTILSAGLERIIGLVQTVVIARLLGIEDYGRYGLIFGAVGLVASLAGFQLGSTATAYIARYRQDDRAAAAGIIVLAEGLGLAAATAALAVMMIAPEHFAAWLFKQASYADVMGVAGILIALAVVGGIQEGILQGFEAFRALAWIRVAVAVITFLLVVIGGSTDGLRGVLSAIAVGGAIRFAAMLIVQKRFWRTDGYRCSWNATWSMRRALFEFSIPAVFGNLLSTVLWYGTYLLSRGPSGFEDVAVATAAQQWRGPVLFLNAALAMVAVPLMSRTADTGGADRIHQLNIWSNLAVAILACLAIAAASTQILAAYGPEFTDQQLSFVLIVASVVGQSHVQVWFQVLTSKQQVWRVLLYQALFIIPFGFGYQLLLPEVGLRGFAWLNFVIWSLAAVALHILISLHLRRDRVLRGRRPAQC